MPAAPAVQSIIIYIVPAAPAVQSIINVVPAAPAVQSNVTIVPAAPAVQSIVTIAAQRSRENQVATAREAANVLAAALPVTLVAKRDFPLE